MWKKTDGFLLILTNGNMDWWGLEKSWGLSYENHTRGRASGGVAILPCTAAVQLKLIIFIYFLTSENKSREEESGKSEPLQLALFLMFVWVFFLMNNHVPLWSERRVLGISEWNVIFLYVNLPYVRKHENLCASTEVIKVLSLGTSYDSKKILKSAEYFDNNH